MRIFSLFSSSPFLFACSVGMHVASRQRRQVQGQRGHEAREGGGGWRGPGAGGRAGGRGRGQGPGAGPRPAWARERGWNRLSITMHGRRRHPRPSVSGVPSAAAWVMPSVARSPHPGPRCRHLHRGGSLPTHMGPPPPPVTFVAPGVPCSV